MTKRVQRRRGTATQHTSFTGAEGEISVNTTNKSIHVHDGVTTGGFEAARADLANVTDANLNAALSGNTLSSLTITSADINGGTIDGATIGGTTPAAATFASATVNGNITVTGTVDGRDLSADGSKLDGIEAGADVTDTANVTAAGALMDSELTNIAAVKALNQGVSTTDSPTFAGATVSGDLTIADKIVHSGDTNTAIRFPAADTVTVETSGAERLRIDSVGNVGVGTSSPQGRLDLAGTTRLIASVSGASPTITAVNAAASAQTNLTLDGSALIFSTLGAEKARIDASGNVGIGAAATSIGGNIRTIDAVNTSGGGLRMQATTTSPMTGYIYVNSGVMALETAGAQPILFNISGTERARIDSAGNVGIGTGSPGSRLHVYQTGDATSEANAPFILGDNIASNMFLYGGVNNTNNYAFLGAVEAGVAYRDFVLQPNGGNLGLGVTPSAWSSSYRALDIRTAGAVTGTSAGIQLWSNAYDSGAGGFYKNTAAAGSYQIIGAAHAWYTAPSGTAGNPITFTQAMTLDASGNLEVRSVSGNGTLTLTSNAATYSSVLNLNSSSGGVSLINASQVLRLDTNGSERARIDASGNLLVGTTNNPWGARLVSAGSGQVATFNTSATTGTAVEIDVGANNTTQQALMVYSAGNAATNAIIYSNGNIVNRNNSYGAISDAKLKENVTDATPKLDKLNQVRIVNFNMIGEEQKQIGVIAQELEQIFPSMVEESPDRDAEGNDLGTTTKSVKYSVFVPMLIKAIQELKAEVDSLRAQLNP